MHSLVEFLKHVAGVVQQFAERLGGPGLALLAFLDSSFLSFPEVTDVLIVLLVVQHPAAWAYYALLTTSGSVAGCYILYAMARKGGEAFLRRRFHERHVDRGLALFQRYGLLAVVVPSILPPPTPFKIFILLAGVADVRPRTFIAAVTIGRGLRYGGEALLAYLYGERALGFIQNNMAQVSLWAGVTVAVLGVGFVVWRRFRPA